MTEPTAERDLGGCAYREDRERLERARGRMDARIQQEHRQRAPRRRRGRSAYHRARQRAEARAYGLDRRAAYSRRSGTSRAAPFVLLTLVLLAAASMRLSALHAAGLRSWGRYDDGVHFAAAIELTHGVLPYGDVLFLQPPGLVLLLTPFAALAPTLGDADAFVLARLAFVLLGVLNTALVWMILRRTTPGLAAALVGSAVYALSPGAVYVEQTTLLEVPGTTAVLLSVLLLVWRPLGGVRWGLAAGALAGAGVGVKIWYLVPALVLLWLATGRRLAFFAGAAAAVLAVYLPFFLNAPSAMWGQVVLAQIGRPRSALGIDGRLASILGVDRSFTGLVVAILVVLAVLAVVSVTGGGTPIIPALAMSSVALLLAGPSFFQHYTALTAGPLALLVGAGIGRAGRMLGRPSAATGTAIVALTAAAAVLLPAAVEAHNGRTVPVAALREALAGTPGCLTTDDPTVLILLDRLSTDLAHGCRVEVDLSGAGYVLVPSGGSTPPRTQNPRFQDAALRYLRGGDAYILARGGGLGLSRTSEAVLAHDGLLFDSSDIVARTTARDS